MFIKEAALTFILGVSRELYPREFGCQLRGSESVIEEAVVLPKTVYGEGFTQTRLDMKPIDKSIIGSAHSHPTNSYRPSTQDIQCFSRSGEVHLILRHPYKSIRDVAAYDGGGNRIPIEAAP